jgi:hypothetical protein
MGRELRKKRRLIFERRAWIEPGNGAPVELCIIENLSETGAKLVLRTGKRLPSYFILRLSEDGRVARKCRVAWQSGNESGVEFVARLLNTPAREHTEAHG